MDRILVASSNDKATAMLVSLLKETFPTCKTSIAATGLETRRAVGSGSYDCVVINCPLSDEYGNELAEIVCTSTGRFRRNGDTKATRQTVFLPFNEICQCRKKKNAGHKV